MKKLSSTRPQSMSYLVIDDKVEIIAIYNGSEGDGPFDGYQIQKIYGQERRYRFVANLLHPLTVLARYKDRLLYLRADKDFEFDLESVPSWAHWFEDQDSHPIAAIFHDCACKDGGLFVALDIKNEYKFAKIPRWIADDMYRQLVMIEPPKAGHVKATVLWIFVRGFSLLLKAKGAICN